MDKKYFLDSFSNYSNQELLDIIKQKINRQKEAVLAAQELLVARGASEEIELLHGQYIDEVNDIPEQIDKLKIARTFCLVLFYLSWGLIWFWVGGKSDESNLKTLSEDHYPSKYVFITIGVFFTVLITAPFNYKIGKLREEDKSKNVDK